MESVDYSVQGTVFDIQRFSIHDGPGIRTIVFLKGCPLRCKWCSNPESQQYYPEVLYRKQLCIGCKACQRYVLNRLLLIVILIGSIVRSVIIVQSVR